MCPFAFALDYKATGDVLTATAIDGGESAQRRFYIPMEDIRSGHLALPLPEAIGRYAAQDLLLRAYRLSMLHGMAPLLSLQRSRVIPKDYQLVSVVRALEQQQHVRMLIADDVRLGKTIETELQVLMERAAHLKDTRGRQPVVRNGYLPQQVQTGIGAVAVKVPRVHDRNGQLIDFSSSTLPK